MTGTDDLDDSRSEWWDGSNATRWDRPAPRQRVFDEVIVADVSPANADGPEATTFGQRLAGLRRSRRLSLRGLALRLRCHHTLVLRWERGQREPTIHDLDAIARVFAVSPDELLRDLELTGQRTWSSRAHPARKRRLVGFRLRLARDRAGLSAWDVYLALGVDGERLIAIERGADPSLGEVRDLARLYEISLRQLLMAGGVDGCGALSTFPRSTTPTHAASDRR